MKNFSTFTFSVNARAPIAQRGKVYQKRSYLLVVVLGLVVIRD